MSKKQPPANLIAIEQLAQVHLSGRTIGAIDLGDKTIGVAVSDLGHSLANPRSVIRRRKFSQDAAALLAQLEGDRAGALIVGLPVNMDGSEGPRVQSTRAFVRHLAPMTALPIVYWDERLSTVAAERVLIEMDVSRGKRRDRIDSAAAAFILQGALDRLAAMRAAAR
ncbi:Holliday junction resolvase RuvX [Chelativorans sp. ZYF759]|uniref:Holliday junction resolvase RuvX n=1 Tax=Chelativorans sp. ZYF759 TaxID=2692213 RepID=UPI00145CA9A2|nr:Holliday junction resolvase RuvX [Chelativorans sp. ZYF759]NMG39145.1 Holliday junction resolvase RuvX [Chelativorans sp. ZYF759]